MEAFLVSTGVVTLGEMGDKTQLLAIVLAAAFRKPLPIILGILVATLANHAAAGAVGGWVAQALGPDILRWVIGLSFLAMAIDVQTNVPRAYTIVGLVLFVLGTWLLYDGITMSWVTGLAGIIGAVLYATTGMPSMVRTRFSTPTIGRRWMIGEMGTAVTDLTPDGTIELRDALWQARTNRATPITAGDSVRVIEIDQLVLEVEPEEGAAKDYRDRS